MDPAFAYETVFPLLIMGTTSILMISTLTTEINFYSRLNKMRDPVTNLPLFVCLNITLACQECIDNGKSHECVHKYHLVPRWQVYLFFWVCFVCDLTYISHLIEC